MPADPGRQAVRPVHAVILRAEKRKDAELLGTPCRTVSSRCATARTSRVSPGKLVLFDPPIDPLLLARAGRTTVQAWYDHYNSIEFMNAYEIASMGIESVIGLGFVDRGLGPDT